MMPYTVYVIPRALRELDDLPGHVRQRARRAISALATEPRPIAGESSIASWTTIRQLMCLPFASAHPTITVTSRNSWRTILE
jgi:hypothetical protein